MKLNCTYLAKNVFCLLLIFSLCSCSFFAVKQERQYSYVLSAIPDVSKHRTHSSVLMVLRPESVQAFNTKQMAYNQRPFELAYYAKNYWADTPSQMLHPLIVKTLQNTHYFQAIVIPPFVGRYDYVLNTQILKLQQNFSRRPAMLEFVVRAQLNRVATNKIVATKEISVSESMSQYTPYAGVYAANRATEELLSELATFCLRNIRNR